MREPRSLKLQRVRTGQIRHRASAITAQQCFRKHVPRSLIGAESAIEHQVVERASESIVKFAVINPFTIQRVGEPLRDGFSHWFFWITGKTSKFLDESPLTGRGKQFRRKFAKRPLRRVNEFQRLPSGIFAAPLKQRAQRHIKDWILPTSNFSGHASKA